MKPLIQLLLTLAFAIGLFSIPAVSNERIKVDIPPGGAEDLLNYKGTTPPGKPPKGSAVKLTTQCTDSKGRVHSASDAGYADCTQVNKNPRTGKPGDQTAPGVSVELGSQN